MWFLLLTLVRAEEPSTHDAPAEAPKAEEAAVTPESPEPPAPAPVKVVHWSEVMVRERPKVTAADYPAEARAMNLGTTRCFVRIQIDETGTPTSVEPKTCPGIFVPSAQAVGMRYRFYPVKGKDGVPIPAGFDLAISFKATQPSAPPPSP